MLEIFEQGVDPELEDQINTWMGIEGVLDSLIDRPEYMREMARRMVKGYMSMLDQLEEQGLLCYNQSLIHVPVRTRTICRAGLIRKNLAQKIFGCMVWRRCSQRSRRRCSKSLRSICACPFSNDSVLSITVVAIRWTEK